MSEEHAGGERVREVCRGVVAVVIVVPHEASLDAPCRERERAGERRSEGGSNHEEELSIRYIRIG
jgi:hypothetical protein